MGIGEGTATGLGKTDVGLVDDRPLGSVAVVLDGDAPQRVAGHDRMGDGGRLAWPRRKRRALRWQLPKWAGPQAAPREQAAVRGPVRAVCAPRS